MAVSNSIERYENELAHTEAQGTAKMNKLKFRDFFV